MATQPGRDHGDPGEVLPLGPDALVVRFATTLDERANRAAVGLARYLSGAGREGVDGAGVSEVASAPASVLVRFDPRVTDRAALTARLHATLRERDWRSEPLAAGRAWRVPACFGGAFGPELAEAASLAGLGETAAVADLCARPLRVLAIGFAPGQPYLGPLGPAWDIARRTALTRRVPAGALVVAVRQVVLFANASPTGWRHVGQTAFRPFRPGAPEPFALRPGDTVRFIAVGAEDLSAILARGDYSGGAEVEDGPGGDPGDGAEVEGAA